MTKKDMRPRLPFLARAVGRRVFFQSRVPSDPHFVLRLVTFSTLALCLVLLLVLLYSYFVVGQTYVAVRLYAAVAVFTYVGVTVSLVRRGHVRAGSYMITGFYYALGVVMMLVWGITMAVGLLMFGFVIMLAGVTLGARRIIPVTVVVVVTMAAVQALEGAGIIMPMREVLSLPTTFVDVVSFSVIFAIFAVVSWLSGRRMEVALQSALDAEKALQKEKGMLASRLEQKTREVREAQLEEMRALYRFAELGQLGTVLLHDLANNLTALTLDIDDIERRNARSRSVKRARQSITYLENLIKGVRERIRADSEPRVFDAVRAVFTTMAELGPKARRAGVLLQYERRWKAPFLVKGDPLRLSQALTIIISNAIDASKGTVSDDETPTVVVAVAVRARQLVITVTDDGPGIPAARREHLFRPFTSTKPDGMGIGLFMAKTMVEQHFGGTLVLNPGTAATTFALTLKPTRAKAAKTRE